MDTKNIVLDVIIEANIILITDQGMCGCIKKKRDIQCYPQA